MRSVLSALAAIAVAVVLLYAPWLWAWWVFPDPSEQDRKAYLQEALERGGVAARLERGRMTMLRRGDVAEVGTSMCVRATECSNSGRSLCLQVTVRFTCTYAVKDRSGNAASAILKIYSNAAYQVGVTVPGSPKPLIVDGALDLSDADDALCELGHWCRPAGDGQERPSEPQAAPANAAVREFQDCAGGVCAPVMVALPQGEYLAGDETVAVDGKLRRKVAIGYPLAVGKFEVTFAEWDACVADGGCKLRPDDRKWGRNRRPVTQVAWDDVTKEYLTWLNRKLGLSGTGAYRLPTDAEWEYAARGVTSSSEPHTRYAWGDEIGTNRANCTGCGSEWEAWKTAPVGSFAPNAFGLHDMHGNVVEWVQNCEPSSRTTVGAPPDSRHCFLRGGSWSETPDRLRSSFWSRTFSISRSRSHGFRVARTLAPSP